MDRRSRHACMKAPMAIFVTLFLAAVAICGTLDAHSNVSPIEPQAIHGENVVGPTDLNLHASCGKDTAHRKGRPTFQNMQDCDSQSAITPVSARIQ